MSFTVVIPARHASTRLPGKMLLAMGGKPMIQHVYERAKESGADRVIIATDSQEICNAVKSFSGEALLTSENHRSGTERIAEVVQTLSISDDSIVVNVQGDEPLIEPELISGVAGNLNENDQASISTVGTPIDSTQEFLNPNIVKVVLDANGHALYFSRAPIPWPRDVFQDKSLNALADKELPGGKDTFFRHVGIYAYRAHFVKTYCELAPSPLEKIESLEQLRALSHGYKISVLVSEKSNGYGVDTQEDYDKVKEIIERC